MYKVYIYTAIDIQTLHLSRLICIQVSALLVAQCYSSVSGRKSLSGQGGISCSWRINDTLDAGSVRTHFHRSTKKNIVPRNRVAKINPKIQCHCDVNMRTITIAENCLRCKLLCSACRLFSLCLTIYLAIQKEPHSLRWLPPMETLVADVSS